MHSLEQRPWKFRHSNLQSLLNERDYVEVSGRADCQPKHQQPAATDGDELVTQASVSKKSPQGFQGYFEARWIQLVWMLPPNRPELTSTNLRSSLPVAIATRA